MTSSRSVTRAGLGDLARPIVRVLVVLGVAAIALAGMVEALGNPTSDRPILYLGIASPALLGVFFSLEVLWSHDGGVLMRGVNLSIRIGSIVVVVLMLVLSIVGMVLTATGVVDAGIGDVFEYSALGFGLLGYGCLLIGAVAGLVIIELPYVAIVRPSLVGTALPIGAVGDVGDVRDVVDDGDVADVGRSRVAIIALAVLLVLVFAVPSLILFGTGYENQPLAMVGWALLPVALAALVTTVVAQRGDGLRRESATAAAPDA